MARVSKTSVTVTTSTAGAATEYTASPINGVLRHIVYTASTNAFSTTADFTITTEDTGIGLWTVSDVDASATVSPHLASQDNTGTDMQFTSTGTDKVPAPIYIANERVKIAIAQGGATKTGTFTAIWEGA